MNAKLAPSLAVAFLVMPALGGTHGSGLRVGAITPAFEPTHVTGADRGTNTCPVCKYGPTPAVQVWVNRDSEANVGKIAQTLERAIAKHGAEKLRVFVVFLNPQNAQGRLSAMAHRYHLKNVALTYVNGVRDEAVGTYKINTSPSIKNTVLVYSGRRVRSNFVNLVANTSGLGQLNAAVERIAR